jgi:predicted GIY-YIG superfamily endonuclease
MEKENEQKKTYVYIIHSDFERTYCGVTDDLERRLKQHNGIIKGGAKSTRGKSWEYFFIIEGFKNRIEALQFEWKMHHPDGKRKKDAKYYGLEGRLLSIKDVFEKHLVKEENKDIKYKIRGLNEYLFYFDDYHKDNILIEELNNINVNN